jgi:cysteine desulfurase / selenocysteine lyase
MMTVANPSPLIAVDSFVGESLMPAEVRALRSDFPIFKTHVNGKPLVYLDNGATTHKPQAMIDRISRFYAEENGTVRRGVYHLAAQATSAFDAVREQVADFLNAPSAEGVVFVRGCTEGINLVAFSYGHEHLKAGDEILITEMEHHANLVPWQELSKDLGTVLKIIPMNDEGVLDLDAYASLLSEKTKFVSLIHVSNALGTVNPVKAMTSEAHAVGAKVLIDGAQSTPHMSVDVQDLDCDFFVFSGHKVYAPTGVGVLWAKPELLNTMRPYQSGGDMIDVVTHAKTTFLDGHRRFEAGTPAIAQVIGLGTSLSYVQAIGLDRIGRYEQELLAYATDALEGIEGLRIYGKAPHKAAVISFLAGDVHPLDLGTLLDLEGVAIRTGHHCVQPLLKHYNVTATARASFSFYNTFADVDVLVSALHKAIRLCG